MTMQDIAELARQSFLARYQQIEEPSTNGHSKNGHRKQAPINCGNCGEEFEKVRYRVRVEQQTKGRKWVPTGLEIFYLCPGCHIVQTTLMIGGL
jgi:hypothetical protein